MHPLEPERVQEGQKSFCSFANGTQSFTLISEFPSADKVPCLQTVFSFIVTPALRSYTSALKSYNSVPPRLTNSKIIPQSWTRSPRSLPAYLTLALLATLWFSAAISLCIMMAREPQAVSDDEDSTSSSSSSSSSSSAASSSNSGCVGLDCKRWGISDAANSGQTAVTYPAISSAVSGWAFL